MLAFVFALAFVFIIRKRAAFVKMNEPELVRNYTKKMETRLCNAMSVCVCVRLIQIYVQSNSRPICLHANAHYFQKDCMSVKRALIIFRGVALLRLLR